MPKTTTGYIDPEIFNVIDAPTGYLQDKLNAARAALEKAYIDITYMNGLQASMEAGIEACGNILATRTKELQEAAQEIKNLKETNAEIENDLDEIIDSGILPDPDRSVNCYFCGHLVDERDCIGADAFNGNDGGVACEACAKQQRITELEGRNEKLGERDD